MDIAIRASEHIGGTRQDMEQLLQEGQMNSAAHFYRGAQPRYCGSGERVFFLENGLFHGYAIFHEYRWCEADKGSGVQDGWAIVLRPPYVSIDPPLRAPKGFNKGQWRWRYIDRDHETSQLLRLAGL